MKKCLRYQMRLLVRSPGFWVAMAFELCFRGAIFLIALSRFDFSKRRGIED